MAQLMSSVPVGIRTGPTATRSNSLASNASTNSGTSLRRKSRTRTRTLPSAHRGKSVGPEGQGDPSASGERRSKQLRDEDPPLPPLSTSQTRGLAPKSDEHNPPPRPPRRSRPGGTRPPFLDQTPNQYVVMPRGRERANSSVQVREIFAEPNRGRQTKSENGSVRGMRLSLRGSSLPRHAFRSPPSSDSSSQPSPLTPTYHAVPNEPAVYQRRDHLRDSISSHVSSTSSSLYPPSTSTGSHAESSILPHSLKDQNEDVTSFSPRIVTHSSDRDSDFDVDDVSYRLRLLVSNSYFLPPAHSKPSPLSLAPPVPQPNKTTKQGPAGILDFFGLGKSKPKSAPHTPSNPTGDFAPAPVLRTTSDSITASGNAPPPFAAHTPVHRPFMLPHHNPTSRVVVLREKMEDLATARKQSEQDIKAKAAEARKHSAPPVVLDVIDPTDAVDLPPQSEYPFAVQASALHGLGPQESIGAAMLAEHLPPSPGLWSMSTEEESWRKALLQDAVSHSLTCSPEASFSSSNPHPAVPTSPSSFRGSDVERPSDESPVSSTPRQKIGQRILDPQQMNMEAEELSITFSPVSPAYPPSPAGMSPIPPTPVSPWVPTAEAPLRAETPAMTYALNPPPRKQGLTAPYSQSQTDLPRTVRDSDGSFSSTQSHLRKVVSYPRLSAMHEDEVDNRVEFVMTPPPMPSNHNRTPQTSLTHDSSHAEPTDSSRPHTESVVSESHYSDDGLSYATPSGGFDDEPLPRPSMSLSLHTSGRPSLSEYSHPSPTASAFHDALFGSCRTPSPMLRRSHASSIDLFPQEPVVNPSRNSAMSPPPRASSSVGPTVLRPPPRSPAPKPVSRPSVSSSAASHSPNKSSHSSTPIPSLARNTEEPEPRLESESSSASATSQPEPTSPPPLAERRGRSANRLSLLVPTDFIPTAIHSAPAPASPTEFFDRMEAQHNAMDDLETSDESDDEPTPPTIPRQHAYFEPRTRTISNVVSPSSYARRPALMRLGNHSTPQLTPCRSNHPPFTLVDPSRQPVGHTAEQGTYFASRKKGFKRGELPVSPIGDSSSSSHEGAVFSYSAGSAEGVTPARPSSPQRPATSDGAAVASGSGRRTRAPLRESLQRFDGMLLQHMAAERDTIKRITTNLSTTSNSRS